MAEPLKNLFNRAVYERFSSVIVKFFPEFETSAFMDRIFDENWEKLELKQRARHTSLVLNDFLTGDYKNDIPVLIRVIEHIQQDEHVKPGIESMFVPDYVEVFGIDHPEISFPAMEKITGFFSCEFAVRPYILKYPEESIQQMIEWSENPNPKVRRLSTEGCRPRLPWAMALPFLKADPAPILPILENLKDDESESVRRSVANNLNDISKDNPGIAIRLFKKWKDHSENTNWVIKHGARSLLKQGHPEVLSLFGYGSAEDLKLDAFKLKTNVVRLGDSLEFSFNLTNKANTKLLVRVEYGMYYLKANGQQNRKVFKISERQYESGESLSITRKQSFKPISTRKYYEGPHRVSLIINGKEYEPLDFMLVLK